MGDFNINLLKSHGNNVTSNFLEVINKPWRAVRGSAAGNNLVGLYYISPKWHYFLLFLYNLTVNICKITP